MKTARSIPDMILWNNLYLFFSEGKFDYNSLGKLAQRLDESGNKNEYATNIIYAINRIDNPQKAKYISWLTLSVIHRLIDFNIYFRLIKTIENLTYNDLYFLCIIVGAGLGLPVFQSFALLKSVFNTID